MKTRKIYYLIKKGLQCYPPCLTQILYLNELGVELEVYHGKNSTFINQLLDNKGIKHYTFTRDRRSQNKADRILNFIFFSQEIRAIQKKLPEDAIIWIGNIETAMSLNQTQLKKSRFILNVLELYDEKTIYDHWLKKMVKYASVVNCCEKHRGAIMQSRYSLKEIPVIMPNKPFDLNQQLACQEIIAQKLEDLRSKFIILYQGIISADRPLENIAKALADINDSTIAFVYMGRSENDKFSKYLKNIYNETYYLGYIPAPQHLAVTAKCDLGIASYDFSTLNNVFCAPNKIYEYSKFGKPMLTSLNLGLTETVGAQGAAECVDFKDRSEICKAILKIRSQYEQYVNCSKLFYASTDYKELVNNVLIRIWNE